MYEKIQCSEQIVPKFDRKQRKEIGNRNLRIKRVRSRITKAKGIRWFQRGGIWRVKQEKEVEEENLDKEQGQRRPTRFILHGTKRAPYCYLTFLGFTRVFSSFSFSLFVSYKITHLHKSFLFFFHRLHKSYY